MEALINGADGAAHHRGDDLARSTVPLMGKELKIKGCQVTTRLQVSLHDLCKALVKLHRDAARQRFECRHGRVIEEVRLPGPQDENADPGSAADRSWHDKG